MLKFIDSLPKITKEKAQKKSIKFFCYILIYRCYFDILRQWFWVWKHDFNRFDTCEVIFHWINLWYLFRVVWIKVKKSLRNITNSMRMWKITVIMLMLCENDCKNYKLAVFCCWEEQIRDENKSFLMCYKKFSVSILKLP